MENDDLSMYKHYLKADWAPNNWPIWIQKVPKEALRCDQATFKEFFQKYFVVHEMWAVKISFSKYVCTKWPLY